MVALAVWNRLLTLSCLIGVGLSVYTFVLHLHVQQQPNYKAMCDIGENISCTKVITTKYARGFGIVAPLFGEDSPFNIPNSLIGIICYSLMALLAKSNSAIITKLNMFLALFSNLISLYLAYILYFVLYNLCVVCVATYVVNFLNLTFTYFKLKKLRKQKPQSKKKKQK